VVALNAVILTYNNRTLLDSCIESVQKSIHRADIESVITVVDNASSDGTEELVAHRFPSIRYLRNSENLGTARGFNRGIEAGFDAAYTMLMNDDVELFPDTISRMLVTLERYPGAWGIPGCPVYPDGSPQRVKLKIFSLTRVRDERVRWARFPGTTACLYRTDVFREIGLFDEFYFFYNEDLDFAVRSKRAGMNFIFDPTIRVMHHLNQGRAKGFRYIKPHFHVANYYFYRKHFGFIIAQLYLMTALLQLRRSLRRSEKQGNAEQCELLTKGRENLKRTVRCFKQMRGSVETSR
jgi:GT2 family glycosyltransferase